MTSPRKRSPKPTGPCATSFYTWLHSIAVNHARNFLKKRNRRMTYSLDDDEYGDHTEKDMNMADETDGADPERRTHLNELQLKINEALKKLSTKHREVVVLHDVKGLNHTEISALLGISEGTLRSRLHYAHKELQGLLAEYLS